MDLENACFQLRSVSSSMKIFKVTSINKSGDYCHYKNYRSVSVLPILTKVLEVSFLPRLTAFLTKNNIFTHNHWFPTDRSTIDAILNFIRDSLKEKEDSTILICDLSKAFADCSMTSFYRNYYATVSIAIHRNY